MEEFHQSHAELVKKRDNTYNEMIQIQRQLERLKQKVELTEYTIRHNCIKHNRSLCRFSPMVSVSMAIISPNSIFEGISSWYKK